MTPRERSALRRGEIRLRQVQENGAAAALDDRPAVPGDVEDHVVDVVLTPEALVAGRGSVVDDAASVREEMAPYVGATPQELWRHTEDCARDAMWAVRASPFPERVLAYEDPLPASTIVALARLRGARP